LSILFVCFTVGHGLFTFQTEASRLFRLKGRFVLCRHFSASVCLPKDLMPLLELAFHALPPFCRFFQMISLTCLFFDMFAPPTLFSLHACLRHLLAIFSSLRALPSACLPLFLFSA